MAKKTYWTKCGRQFEKSSTAEVTGYKVDEASQECAACPFRTEVTKGWPPVFDHWECRAGSKKPNLKTDWTGSLEDKNTIGVNSLDHQLMEEIRQYCIDHPELSASYNTDHLADCRRTLSISCSSNKKGITAKKELVEKFFGDKKQIANDSPEKKIQEMWDTFVKCESCSFSEDYGDAMYINCTEGAKKKRVAKSKAACHNFVPAESIHTECFDEEIETPETAPEKKKPRIGTESVCNDMREDCPYFCKHNDGCSVLLCRGDALEAMLENFGEVNCDVCRRVTEKVNLDSISRFIKGQEFENESSQNALKMSDSVNDLAETDTKTAETVTFDYSLVDEDTAIFLQEKVEKITLIRLRSKFAIGKELKEAQEKLANNKNGTFGAWASSIGISRQTAYNYINGYEFIVKNFDNIEAAEDLSPSLLFAAAKKDAPKELTEQVVSGDITSLKEYKALEEKLKAAEERAGIYAGRADESEKRERAREQERDFEADKAHKNYMRIRELEQQLEQAKRNSDPAKVQELGNIISDKQQEIETLKEQLKDKPIEVPAVKEVVPDEVRLAIYEKVSRLYEGLCKLTETEIQIFAEDVSEDYRDDVIKGTEDASEVLANIANAVWKLTE